jgi:hypothetical protein
MYHHHLQEVEERQNYDWLQNMFYDIIQQAIHQSSAYYLIYVVLAQITIIVSSHTLTTD